MDPAEVKKLVDAEVEKRLADDRKKEEKVAADKLKKAAGMDKLAQ